MRIYTIVLTILACVALVIGSAPAEAKGPPEWVRISGSTVFGPLEVRDPDHLAHLGSAQLENIHSMIAPPTGIHHILHIARGFDGENGQPITFDEVLYALDPEGGPGYVYYLGIVNGSGPSDGNWYRASEAGHRSLIAALEGAGVSPAGYPATPPPARPEFPDGIPAALVMGAAVLAGTGGWLIGRRSVSAADAPAGEPV